MTRQTDHDDAADPAAAPPDDPATPTPVDPVRSPERRRIQALAKEYRERFRHRHATDD